MLTASVWLPGCRPATADPSEPWSTKSMSVIDSGEVRLNVGSVPAGSARDVSGVRQVAIELLREASASPEPLLRANAIEALHLEPDYVLPAAQTALGDENRGVRFAAAMTVGKLRLVELADLCEPLLHDPSPSVRAAAIFALQRTGRPVDLTPLGRMLESDEPEIRANAALVLGELGNPSALPMLAAAARRPMARATGPRARVVELQIAESMVRLGADEELQVIRAALFSPSAEQGEIKALAALACGRLRDEVYAGTLYDLATRGDVRREPAEIRMAATFALAQIEPRSAPMEVALEYVRSDRPELRAQAALTLGESDNPDPIPVVSQMMSDENPIVQVAAAGAILRLTGT
jgi:HEAT repeat protein